MMEIYTLIDMIPDQVFVRLTSSRDVILNNKTAE